MEQFREDVTCSICWDHLKDPVSIECGHKFCRSCLVTHWRGVSAQGRRCPECRRPCARDRMIPDRRLRGLVGKMAEPPQAAKKPVRPDRPKGQKGPGSCWPQGRDRLELWVENGTWGPSTLGGAGSDVGDWGLGGSVRGIQSLSLQQEPGAEPEPGRPVQLVRLDKEGDLILDEEALSRCLEQGGVGGAPVCLVSIIGEQRRGKSFLLNCLLHRLHSPAKGSSWMSGGGACLGEFECHSGTASVTKGVWIWSQPFWVQAEERQVAVFLVDTEGCLDLQRDMETSIKLSVFSILLSSYWIFNISGQFTRMEADYLEMFIQVAKEIGATCDLAEIQPDPSPGSLLQRLDLLVRDWQLSEACGAAGGQEYLTEITQDPKCFAEQPLVLGALKSSSTRCFLLPHPGTGFTRRGAGRAGDMEEGFRQHLCQYITGVARASGSQIWRDRAGQELNGAQLAARIQEFSQDLKARSYDFSSPKKMAESMAEMRQEKKNREIIKAARRDYEDYLHAQSMSRCRDVEPAEMQQRLERKRRELLGRRWRQLQGRTPQRQAALEELEKDLDRQIVRFMSAYEERHERWKKNVKIGQCVGGAVLGVVGLGIGGGVGVGLAAKGGLGLAGADVGCKVGAWLADKIS
ncbi:RING finger protein 112-like isoform X2 [Pelodiscus sinensis]|uniref:RING finger protein 112-like isoform X2 n=1 Tax=Pelodiscus sinensis TaxID=13735 RepID=UPI003F6C9928